MNLAPAVTLQTITLEAADKRRIVLRAGQPSSIELRIAPRAPICLRWDRFSIPLFASVPTEI